MPTAGWVMFGLLVARVLVGLWIWAARGSDPFFLERIALRGLRGFLHRARAAIWIVCRDWQRPAPPPEWKPLPVPPPPAVPLAPPPAPAVERDPDLRAAALSYFRRRSLLSEAESRFLRVLVAVLPPDLVVCPKVRLADVINCDAATWDDGGYSTHCPSTKSSRRPQPPDGSDGRRSYTRPPRTRNLPPSGAHVRPVFPSAPPLGSMTLPLSLA